MHAGGTDLLGCLREHIFAVKKVVSISAVKELRGIAEDADGALRIGALTTIRTVAEHPLVAQAFQRSCSRRPPKVASPQLRNQGTIGGNICQKPRCWYYRGDFNCLRKGGDTCFAVDGENQFHCIFGGGGTCFIVHPSDTAPGLVALNATARVAGPSGVRDVPLEKFFVLPEVDVRRETVLEPARSSPKSASRRRPPEPEASYRKVRARRSWDFALAGVALALRFDGRRVVDGRVVLSGAAPVPWRSAEVEHAIRGKELTSEVIAAAAQGRCGRGRASRKERLQDSAVPGCDRGGVDANERPCLSREESSAVQHFIE